MSALPTLVMPKACGNKPKRCGGCFGCVLEKGDLGNVISLCEDLAYGQRYIRCDIRVRNGHGGVVTYNEPKSHVNNMIGV